jgi:hypothetical protein
MPLPTAPETVSEHLNDRAALRSCDLAFALWRSIADAAGRWSPTCVSACNFDPLSEGIGVQN